MKNRAVFAIALALIVSVPLSGCSGMPEATEDSNEVTVPGNGEQAESAAMVYSPPSESSDPVKQCKIKEASQNKILLGDNNFTQAGFPVKSRTARSGVVKWALIPIDFKDLPGDADFRARVDPQMSLLSEWFKTVSNGELIVEWVVLDEWARVPGKSSEYEIPQSMNLDDAANGPKLFRAAMNAADPIFDFTDIQTVNFILPKGQTFVGESSQGFPWDGVVKAFKTNEGAIDSFSMAGKFFDDPQRTYWSYWAHEFGHAMALPHVGASRGSLPPFNPWDLMGGQDGPSRELSGWLRFLAGWLEEEQVFCKDADAIDSLEMTLVPLSNEEAGLKFAIVPISSKKALLVESRRETKFSCKTPTPRNGVLVYIYDATLGHGDDFLIASSPPGRGDENLFPCVVEPNPDFLLRTGDKVLVDGLTVEVLEHGNLDKIRISRE